ncbi:MAG: hypothetical protein WD490_08135 [Opitutales bacterium]
MNLTVQTPVTGDPSPLPRLGIWILVLSVLFPLWLQTGHAEDRRSSEERVPPFVLSGESESLPGEVYEVVSTRLADLVIVSAGYRGGIRPGMLCVVHRYGSPVAEILLVEVRDHISAAIIREMVPEQVIQPGDAVQIKTVHF